MAFLLPALQAMGQAASGVASGAAGAAGSAASGLGTAASGAAQGLGTLAGGAMEGVGTLAGNAAKGFGQAAQGVGDAVFGKVAASPSPIAQTGGALSTPKPVAATSTAPATAGPPAELTTQPSGVGKFMQWMDKAYGKQPGGPDIWDRAIRLADQLGTGQTSQEYEAEQARIARDKAYTDMLTTRDEADKVATKLDTLTRMYIAAMSEYDTDTADKLEAQIFQILGVGQQPNLNLGATAGAGTGLPRANVNLGATAGAASPLARRPANQAFRATGSTGQPQQPEQKQSWLDRAISSVVDAFSNRQIGSPFMNVPTATTGTAKPLPRVRTMEEAEALIPGTVFIDPYGVKRTR